MGNLESNDKEKDMTIPSHLYSTFRKSAYADAEYPTSEKNDDRYGECAFLEATYDKLLVKKRLKIKDDRQYQLFLKNREQRMTFDTSYFVKLIDYDSGAMPQDQTENDTYKYFIDSYLEHHSNDLQQDISARRSVGDHYSVAELQKLMDTFIKVGTVLNDCASRHGDLRPDFVIIDESGKYLLLENFRDKTGTGGRVAFVAESDLYISPILFKCYCRNVIKYKHDKSKDDVFSAGMIILEAGILDSVQGCYDRAKGKLDLDVHSELLERFEAIYGNSPQLCQRLKSMLAYEESDRCSFKEIGSMTAVSQPQKASQNTGYQSSGYQSSGFQSSGYGYQSSPQQASYGYNAPQSPQYMQGGYSPQVQSPMPANRFGSPQPISPSYGYAGQPQQPGMKSNPLAARLGNY